MTNNAINTRPMHQNTWHMCSSSFGRKTLVLKVAEEARILEDNERK